MTTYLDLVNKVVAESQSEQDELTSGDWDSAEAGRRIYPRIKRNVADAWKHIQMTRNEWEFMTGSLSTILYPRVRIAGGDRAAGTPTVGIVFVGAQSGFSMTISALVEDEGDWTTGTGEAVFEFVTYTGSQPIPGETFEEESPGSGTFVYLGKAGYDFLEVNQSIREPQWTTFFYTASNGMSYPIHYVPWDNWVYNEYTFSVSSQTGPTYLSQDNAGKIVFYPQTFSPFRVNFIYYAAPQILSDWDDEIERLPEEYHDWIAWKALMMYALSDKNPTLFSYARDQETFYRLRAERNLMPLMSRAKSRFDE